MSKQNSYVKNISAHILESKKKKNNQRTKKFCKRNVGFGSTVFSSFSHSRKTKK